MVDDKQLISWLRGLHRALVRIAGDVQQVASTCVRISTELEQDRYQLKLELEKSEIRAAMRDV